VVHTAALAGVWGKAKDYEAVNVLGTELILDAAKRAGCRAMVYTSSPSVTFGGRGQEGIDESVPYPETWLCHYPRTKAIAEGKVLEANREGGLLTCALRPHLIWGEGDPHLIPRLIERCKQGRLAKIGSGNQQIDTVHVELAADAHWRALRNLMSDNPRCGGKPYFITDGSPIACWEWISMILNAAGLSPPRRQIPTGVAYGLGAMLEWCYRAAGRQEEPPMTRFVALQLGLPHFFSIQAAGRDFGYHPRIDRIAMLEQMKPWLQKLRGL
jgi:nucleoside-diphosphate-sugar epimerase